MAVGAAILTRFVRSRKKPACVATGYALSFVLLFIGKEPASMSASWEAQIRSRKKGGRKRKKKRDGGGGGGGGGGEKKRRRLLPV